MEEPEGINRRVFVASGLLAAAAGAGAFRGVLSAWPGPAQSPCARATPFAAFCGEEERGEPLHVTGTVFAADGVTPAAGVTLYAYHTDAEGHYNRRPNAAPRLRGWMKTGTDGRYGYRTIKPAPYPNRRNAAHVHTQFWGGRVPLQYGEDLLFEGDSLLTEEERRRSAALGRFAFIQPLEQDGRGVWRAVHDLRVKPTGDRFEENTMHGIAPCGVDP